MKTYNRAKAAIVHSPQVMLVWQEHQIHLLNKTPVLPSSLHHRGTTELHTESLLNKEAEVSTS